MEMQQYSGGGGGPPQAVHVTHQQHHVPVPQPQYQQYTQPMHTETYTQPHDMYAQNAYHQQQQQHQQPWQAADPNAQKAAPKRRRKK
jgi:hypothetical protein